MFDDYLERLTGGAPAFCCVAIDTAAAESALEWTGSSVGTETVSSHSDFTASRPTAVTN